MDDAPSRPAWNRKLTARKFASLAAVVILYGILAGYFVWEWDRHRKERWAGECLESLDKLDGWKGQWALERNLAVGTQVTWEDYIGDLTKPSSEGYLKTPEPRECPSGRGIRVVNPVGTDPTCTSGLEGHALPYVSVTITLLE